jgi:hypothetical protein
LLLDVSGRESSPFERPLDKYGLDGEKASGELLSFSDSSGSPQVRAHEDFFVSNVEYSIRFVSCQLKFCKINEILLLMWFD